MEGGRIRSTFNRRWQPATWLVRGALLLTVLAIVVATTAADRQGQAPFWWLKPTSVPANWHRVSTPGGRAVLSYPPAFERVHSDPGAVSAAVGASPRYVAYLNVTPRQGREALRGFSAFRVNLIGDDHDRNVHLDASVEGVTLNPGRASALVDDYITKVRSSHYREIVALVVGKHGSWVIVGAALNSQFVRFQSDLQRAVAAFSFSSS
jgi:hypothetical protein